MSSMGKVLFRGAKGLDLTLIFYSGIECDTGVIWKKKHIPGNT